jgi:hypothetical protein
LPLRLTTGSGGREDINPTITDDQTDTRIQATNEAADSLGRVRLRQACAALPQKSGCK